MIETGEKKTIFEWGWWWAVWIKNRLRVNKWSGVDAYDISPHQKFRNICLCIVAASEWIACARKYCTHSSFAPRWIHNDILITHLHCWAQRPESCSSDDNCSIPHEQISEFVHRGSHCVLRNQEQTLGFSEPLWSIPNGTMARKWQHESMSGGSFARL